MHAQTIIDTVQGGTTQNNVGIAPTPHDGPCVGQDLESHTHISTVSNLSAVIVVMLNEHRDIVVNIDNARAADAPQPACHCGVQGAHIKVLQIDPAIAVAVTGRRCGGEG